MSVGQLLRAKDGLDARFRGHDKALPGVVTPAKAQDFDRALISRMVPHHFGGNAVDGLDRRDPTVLRLIVSTDRPALKTPA